MLAVILGFLAKLLPDLFSRFLAKPNPIATQAKEAGAAEADLATSQKTVQAEQAIAAAEANAPKSKAAVVDRLDRGTF